MSGDKSGSPPCGIYVRIDDFSDMPKLILALRQMAMTINRASGYEKNMAVVELAYSAEYAEKVADLVMLVQAEGLVAILANPPNNYDIFEADGVMLKGAEEIAAAREALGKDAIIGVACGMSKSCAKSAAQAGADFVSFAPDIGLLAWWSMEHEAPCLVSGDLNNDNCGSFARAGAGFVDVTRYIFEHDEGVMKGTVNVLYALDLATQGGGTLN